MFSSTSAGSAYSYAYARFCFGELLSRYIYMDGQQASQPSRNGPVHALVATLNAALPPSNALVLRIDWIAVISLKSCTLDVVFYSVGTYKSCTTTWRIPCPVLWLEALKGHQVGPGLDAGMNRPSWVLHELDKVRTCIFSTVPILRLPSNHAVSLYARWRFLFHFLSAFTHIRTIFRCTQFHELLCFLSQGATTLPSSRCPSIWESRVSSACCGGRKAPNA